MTQVPILEALLHPPIGALTRELIPGTFTGSQTFTRPGGPLAVNAYGITFDIFTIPDGYGFTLGFPKLYDERICQAATVHTGLDSHDLISEYHDFHAEGIYWLWSNPFPSYVQLEISPGIELVVYWLIV